MANEEVLRIRNLVRWTNIVRAGRDRENGVLSTTYNTVAIKLSSEHLSSVTFVVFDFDGVFTDNRVLVGEDGRESVFCSRSDGLGLQMLGRVGVGCLVLSTETNPVVSARAAKLRLECVQGLGDEKWSVLLSIMQERGLSPATVAYVGNDINDLDCLLNVGVSICVADAYPAVQAVAQFITSRSGGHGAVREVCDLILQAQPPSGS